jgi:hypothetical protein
MLSRRHGAVAPLAVGLLAEHLGAGALWVTAMPSVSAFVTFLPAGVRGATVGTAKGRYWHKADRRRDDRPLLRAKRTSAFHNI